MTDEQARRILDEVGAQVKMTVDRRDKGKMSSHDAGRLSGLLCARNLIIEVARDVAIDLGGEDCGY